jgi:hybrid cluster-associated redox disulfide protein
MHRRRLDDPDLPLRLLFEGWPAVIEVFRAHGMVCFGCPIAPFHTVSYACADYAMNETAFRVALQQGATSEADLGKAPDAEIPRRDCGRP